MLDGVAGRCSTISPLVLSMRLRPTVISMELRAISSPLPSTRGAISSRAPLGFRWPPSSTCRVPLAFSVSRYFSCWPSNSGLPTTKPARVVLMKLPPLRVMPLGLARM
ncbi:hypothetical protein D3C71_1521840 [compost metagenome]